MSVVDRSFDHPLKLEERASMYLAGGLMQQGYQCGMIWGAALAAGARAYRLLGPSPQAETEAIFAAQRLVESFRVRNKHIDCFDITQLDLKSSSRGRFITQLLKFFIKGGPVSCFRMAASYAPVAFREIDNAFSEKPGCLAATPVSCSALLAQKMGLPDMHQVMAAGLAGGIGLSGGACGALGVAVWTVAMKNEKEGDAKNQLTPPGGKEILDRFMECTGFQFECSRITGRRFESVSEHAEFIRAGGCSKLIEALAAPLRP